jgi:VIT1/CCC1 family predicted Fe2+/Mn2+ transporter
MGALTSFWLVVLSSLPAAIPFLLIDNARLALRVSNAVLLIMMFFIGYWYARWSPDPGSQGSAS